MVHRTVPAVKVKQVLLSLLILVATLIRDYRPNALISHSFGSVASIIALGKNPDLKIEHYIGITVPNKLRERLEEIARYLGTPL